MKKFIWLAILLFVVVKAIGFYFENIYVPSGEEFDIKYTNLRKMDPVGMPEEEKYEFTDHGIFTRTNFVKQDDKVGYIFDVVNDGTLDAKLKYAPLNLSSDYYFKKHIKYELKYENGDLVLKDDEIKSGETKTIILTITYNRADAQTKDSQFYESNTYFWYIRK